MNEMDKTYIDRHMKRKRAAQKILEHKKSERIKIKDYHVIGTIGVQPIPKRCSQTS